MEKVPKGQHFSFPMVRLYKNDVKEIYSIMKSNSKDGYVEFILGDYRIDDLSELEKLDEEYFTSMSMNSIFPFVELSLNNFSATLYLSDIGDVRQLGIKDKIESILSKSVPIYGSKRALSIYPLLLAFSFSIALVICIALVIGWPPPSLLIFSILFISVAILGFELFVHKTRFDRFSIIYNDLQKNRPGFFRRNKDALIIETIMIALATLWAYLAPLIT